jgi:histidyl-tRNA synthetase
VVATGDRSLKAQLRQANALGARWALISGDAEVEAGTVQLRNLARGEQETLPLDEAVARLARVERVAV